MRILYIGDGSFGTTSLQRARALTRLGHEVTLVDPRAPIPKRRWAASLAVRTGFRVFEPWINRHVLDSVSGMTFDLTWLNNSPEVGPALAAQLRRQSNGICGYVNDDPFGGKDGRKWDLFKRALPLYDQLVVVRPPNVPEAHRAGVRKVVHAFMSCDPVAHAALDWSEAESTKWASEVTFVGNWFRGRGRFLAKLLALGVPLTIRGVAWQKSREIAKLRGAWTTGAAAGKDYVRAIQNAKVAIGLLNPANRDLHTTRSSEIPFIGGAVFCAERTTEHEMLYVDGKEAVFWSSPEECADLCHRLLEDEPHRRRIAAAARTRVLQWRLLNDDILAAVLRIAEGRSSDHPLVSASMRQAHG